MAASITEGSAFDNFPGYWSTWQTFLGAWDDHINPDHWWGTRNTGEFNQHDTTDQYILNPTPSAWGWVMDASDFSGKQYVLEGNWNNDGDTWTSTALNDLGFIVQGGTWANTDFAGDPPVRDGYIYYSLFGGEEDVTDHTLYGQISSITFGYGLQTDTSGANYYSNTVLTISGLDTIDLNGGVDANGDVIGRSTGANDTHEIVWGLMTGDSSYLEDILTAELASGSTSLQFDGDLNLIGLAETTEAELALA